MGEPLRILLVEDSEDDASLLLREIKKGGYESTFVRVETAEAMVRCLNEQTWDIVISDYSLPNFSAPEALKVLQDSGLDLPFIIVSGKVADDVVVDVLTAGAHDFVRKDNMVRLIPAINREVAEAIGRAEHEKAQIALKESEEKYSALFKNNYSIMLLIDPQTGNIVDANPSACAFYGYNLTELTQKKIHEINLLSVEEVQQEMNNAKLEQRNHFFFRHRLASGEIRDVEVYSAPITVKSKSLLYSIIHDITERKHAEEELAASKNRFMSIYARSPVGIEIYDNNGLLLDVNKSCLKIFGISDIGQIKGFNLFEDPNLSDESKGNIKNGKSIELEIIFDFDLVHEMELYDTINTGKCNLYLHIAPFESEDGASIGYLVHVIDITERKQAEKSLKRYTTDLELNKRRLDVLLQLTSMADSSIGEISRFVLEEGAKLTGSEIGFIGLINEDDTILTNIAWTNNVMDVCSVIDTPLKFIVDGAGIWIEPLLQRKSVIINDYESTELNKNGIPEGHIPLKRLINVPIFEGDRIVALIAMANKEDEYNETDIYQLTLLLEGMWSIIQRNRVRDEKDVLINDVGERTKELSVLYGISKLAAQTDTTLESMMEQAITLIPTGWQYPEITCVRVILNENEYTTANFAKTMWGQIAPIRISGELVGLVEVYYLEDMPKIDEGPFYREERDLINTIGHHLGSIAERKMAEDEILRFNSELEQRVKDRTVELEDVNKELIRLDKVKSEFMDTVNHELRTPLTSIIGYSKLLLDGVQGGMSEKQIQYIERIWVRGNHQLQLVNDLLDFSKLESGNMKFISESIPVATAIDEVVSNEMPLLKEKGQEIIIEIADDVVDVYVDEMRLKQVMLNIVNNAIKFTYDNGKIVIKADNVDEMVKISIIDSGIGIKEDDIGKLFKKFVQIDQSNSRSFGGTGLGLTIAKELVELMGGRIDIESEYGKGSTFSIFLPQESAINHNAAS